MARSLYYKTVSAETVSSRKEKTLSMEGSMKRVISFLSAILFLSQAAFAANYEIDPTHSTVGFKINHLTISRVSGRFAEFKGVFSFNPVDVPASSAEAAIVVKSLNTDQAKRDEHLRSEDFFDVLKFPEMKFKSREIRDVIGEKFKVAGDLSIRGITKPVVLDVTYGGTVKDMSGAQRAAFSATTKISRKDFGLTWNKVLETGQIVVGDEVFIDLEIEGVRRP